MCNFVQKKQCNKATLMAVFTNFATRMKKKGDHRPRNSAQYERIVDLLIKHKAKRTPRQLSLLFATALFTHSSPVGLRLNFKD